MSYQVTQSARNLFSQPNIEPNVVLEIEGFDDLFGANVLKVIRRFGGGKKFGDPDFFFGVASFEDDGIDWISLSGTTQTISAQLEPDKGGASSTQQMVMNLIDYNGLLSDLFYPSEEKELLYREALIYLGPKAGRFPDDYITLFVGKITQVAGRPGSISITVSHPEELKKSEVFIQATSILDADLNFKRATIQDLTFQQQGDVSGSVSVEFRQYVGTPPGQEPRITVSGNDIVVEIESGVTLAKSIKRFFNTDPDSAGLAICSITGDGENPQVAQAPVILSTDTEISLDTVSGWLTPKLPEFRTYARINDEIIEYTGIDAVNNKLTGCVRASLSSIGSNHEVGDDVSSFYRLGDGSFENSNAIDLSLKTLLSGSPEYWKTEIKVFSFVLTEPSVNVANAIFFNDVDIASRYGVTIGDFITVVDATNPSNNVVEAEILDVVRTLTGSYVVVDQPIVFEATTSATASFKSRYNILPDGIGLTPQEVDVAQFMTIKDTYSSQIGVYDIYMKETQNSKELINEKIFLPSAMYSVPRKGRVSVAITAPPLYDPNNILLDLDAVISPSNLSIDRGISKNFYNTVVYKFNEDSVDNRLLSGRVYFSADSVSRIKAPNKVLTIEASGFRPSPLTELLIQRNAQRFLDRYKFAAESITIQVPFRVGWTIEIADTVLFGDSKFQIPDSVEGGRDFIPRIFEVQNKEMNWKTGLIRLTLVDTNYNAPVRYVVWSPASKVDSGSTTSVIRLKQSFGYQFEEPRKWANFIGYKVKIRSPDFSTVYLAEVIGLVPGDPSALEITPIAGVPLENWIMELPSYDDVDSTDKLWKEIFGFFDPVASVTVGTSDTTFDVDDSSLFFEGSVIYVHNSDFTNRSLNVRVLSVSGNTLVVSESLGFTPGVGDKVQLIGFASDEGAPYAWL